MVARERVLTDDELVRVWNAAAQIGYPFGWIVQLLILTGQRRGEIASLQWEWIDGGTITLPNEVVKNNRTHTFPVGTLASQIIHNIPQLADLLFPARGNNSVPFGGWSKAKPRLDNLSGVAGYTLHDCRRTFAVGLQRCGVRVDDRDHSQSPVGSLPRHCRRVPAPRFYGRDARSHRALGGAPFFAPRAARPGQSPAA